MKLTDFDYKYVVAGPETEKAIETLTRRVDETREVLQDFSAERGLDVKIWDENRIRFSVPEGQNTPEGWAVQEYRSGPEAVPDQTTARGREDKASIEKFSRGLDVQNQFHAACVQNAEARPPEGAHYRFEKIEDKTIIACPPTLVGKGREYFLPQGGQEISPRDYHELKTPSARKAVTRTFRLGG